MLTMPFSKTCSEILRVNRCLSLGRDGKPPSTGNSAIPCYSDHATLSTDSYSIPQGSPGLKGTVEQLNEVPLPYPRRRPGFDFWQDTLLWLNMVKLDEGRTSCSRVLDLIPGSGHF